MRRAAALVLAIVFAACENERQQPSAAQPKSKPTATVATIAEGEPQASAPMPARVQSVVIESPREGDRVASNPIVVEGRARTFENHVALVVRDESGNEIARTFAIATGDAGNFNLFRREILLTRWPGSAITIEAIDYSAKDGSIASIDRRRIAFAVPQKSVTLHFMNVKRAPNDCSVTFPVQRVMPATKSLAKAAIAALIEGPTPAEAQQGYSSPFPEGSELRMVSIADGVAKIDFNDRLQNVGGSCRALGIRAVVNATLRGMAGGPRSRDHGRRKQRARIAAVSATFSRKTPC